MLTMLMRNHYHSVNPHWNSTHCAHHSLARSPHYGSLLWCGCCSSYLAQHCHTWSTRSTNIRRKAACDKMPQIVENHPKWPVYQDFFNHPPPRPTCRKPISSDLSSANNPTLHLSGEMNGSLSLWPTRISSLTLLSGFQVSILVVLHGLC